MTAAKARMYLYSTTSLTSCQRNCLNVNELDIDLLVQALIKLVMLAMMNGFKSQVTTFASARMRSNKLIPAANIRKRSFDVAPRVQRLR
jgi:hypothetical protein